MTAHTSGKQSVTPELLANLSSFELRARMLVEGLVSGMHRSPYRGVSVEFTEHRKYSQGDDLKHLDWKVFGRSDKYYVKQYEQETNLRLLLVVDASESMAYRSSPRGLSKYEYASCLAVGLAYLVLQQNDAVGLVTFDEQPGRIVRASNRRGQYQVLQRELDRPPIGKKTRIRQVLDGLAEKLRQRHIVVVLSDLFDDPNDVLRGLRHLRHRRHEPVVLHVMDHAETEFPFTQRTRFIGMEELGPLVTEPRAIRERYLSEVRGFVEQLRRGCHDLRADYERFDTSRPLDSALTGYLATRAQRAA
ncbi:MAG: DUF58 domain-containing protein [Phycisphaerae bacterium]